MAIHHVMVWSFFCCALSPVGAEVLTASLQVERVHSTGRRHHLGALEAREGRAGEWGEGCASLRSR